MHGIKIPQQEFVLKMQGGGGLMCEGWRICRTLRYITQRECFKKEHLPRNKFHQAI